MPREVKGASINTVMSSPLPRVPGVDLGSEVSKRARTALPIQYPYSLSTREEAAASNFEQVLQH